VSPLVIKVIERNLPRVEANAHKQILVDHFDRCQPKPGTNESAILDIRHLGYMAAVVIESNLL
jgi:hypothetical protein